MQLTAVCNNHLESLEAERETCKQHRAAIAELAEDALAAKVGTLCHVSTTAQQWKSAFSKSLMDCVSASSVKDSRKCTLSLGKVLTRDGVTVALHYMRSDCLIGSIARSSVLQSAAF